MTRIRTILNKYKSKVVKVVKDNVNHPSHYTQGAIECIDAIKEATKGLFGIEAVCTANIIKYVWRWKFKNGLEDLDKASWYLDKLKQEVRNQKKN
jgi:hypothetical protein